MAHIYRRSVTGLQGYIDFEKGHEHAGIKKPFRPRQAVTKSFRTILLQQFFYNEIEIDENDEIERMKNR